MNSLLIGLVGALLSTNQPAAISNLVHERTGGDLEFVDANDPVEKEFHAVMVLDDDAQTEVDKWIRDNNEFAKSGAGIPAHELNLRIVKRFDPVRKAYDDFIAKHPNYARARVAYASLLDDLEDEDGSLIQLEKARELDPKDPAIWNNLANHYGHSGELAKAFDYYTRAIELNPKEPIYYHNFGTTVFLFRKDAMAHYHFTEQQVFDKALELYRLAMKMDPDNFPLASDVAQTYYGIRPWRVDEALGAWTNALKIAHDSVEREGVYIHMARIENANDRFAQATAHINSVTNATYDELKKRVAESIIFRKAQVEQAKTNPPVTLTNAPLILTNAPTPKLETPSGKSNTTDKVVR